MHYAIQEEDKNYHQQQLIELYLTQRQKQIPQVTEYHYYWIILNQMTFIYLLQICLYAYQHNVEPVEQLGLGYCLLSLL